MSETRAEAILFDLDGTFADTAPDLGAALNRLRADLDLPPLPLSTLRPFVSQGVRGMLRAGLDMLPGHPDYQPFYDRFLGHYQLAICVDTVLFEGMATLVDDLESHGIAWGIVTNKSQRFTAPLMESLGYARRAACIVSGDSASRPKPHAHPMHLACALAGRTRPCSSATTCATFRPGRLPAWSPLPQPMATLATAARSIAGTPTTTSITPAKLLR